MELEKSTKPFDETTISDVKNLTSAWMKKWKKDLDIRLLITDYQ